MERTTFLRPVCKFKWLVYALAMLLPGINPVKAQVLKDTVTLNLVKQTVDQIYSMRFGEAAETCNRISQKYPEHPAIFLLRGMITFWKDYPLMYASGASREFTDQMHMCIEKCENPVPENEAEFLLVNLCARGSLLAFYTGNDLQSRAFSLGRSTYRYFRRSFGYSGVYPDFYFFTGLYNYYREAYPEAHPAYKPLFIVFPRGDKGKGINQLRTAFNESIFMKAEASTFLSSIYKYFEGDYKRASYFSRTIYNEYPRNPVYLVNCVEDLLLTQRYNEAEKLLNSYDLKNDNRYFMAQLTILRGILYEKKYADVKKAQQEYSAGIENISGYSDYGKLYAAYAYFGLSRISASMNDRHNQRVYRRKALDLSDFGNVNFD